MITCHSGGAIGSDTIFENESKLYGIKTNAYSYKTKSHNSENKVEISEEDYQEGVEQIKKANLTLKRYGIHKFMNLLARNWAQVKYSNQIFAIGTIIDPNQKNSKGYINKSKTQVVDGGTGYAVQMSIDSNKDVYVFDQIKNQWFKWSYIISKFIPSKELPKISTDNFAGIGTREINQYGVDAIKELLKRSF